MNNQKPTEAIPVKKTIADATKFSEGLSSVELTEVILTALSAAGFVIVPRIPTEAMTTACIDASAGPDGLDDFINAEYVYAAMISAAEKGE